MPAFAPRLNAYMPYIPYRQIQLQGVYQTDYPFIVPYQSPGESEKFAQANVAVSTPVQHGPNSNMATMSGEFSRQTWTVGPYGLGADTTTTFDWQGFLNKYGMWIAGGLAALLLLGDGGGSRRRRNPRRARTYAHRRHTRR
jgi:hypothetical protein